MVSLSSFISIALWVGPWLIPRALAFFRSIQASNRQPGSVRPVPPRVQTCLNLLYVFVVISLVQTLPYFAPPNIFKETASRLQIPYNVLFTRLTAIRNGKLTPLDTALRDRYINGPTDFALLYAAYGPDVVANCPICKVAEPYTFMYYALPSLLVPHLVHIFLLGLITSSFISGKEGTRWRSYATVAGVALAAADLTLFLQYDWRLNATKRTLREVDFFFWRLRTLRLLSFAAIDGLLGWALWLTSTNRWLVEPPSIGEQIDATSLHLTAVHHKLQALGQLQNTVFRDDGLRGAGNQYWAREQSMMQKIEQEREVMDAKRLALSRMDYDRVKASADLYVDKLWQGLKSQPPQPQGLRMQHEHAE